ncbi:hypothetical protein [Methylobacterium sp. J-068]|uniref:hypothetical protein n=1 Tax=Methylobacterium sp. J-068 TaxID=2836649 RepID=UPI001FBA534D|nr:hypothetical protein [Methylobacterium sp. J-068]MCJ2035667.1 hypothetical protein [Methylobacterium sp. J-068]
MIVRVTLAACAALYLLAGPAGAANRKVDIVNKTGMAISHFYASSTGTDDWEEDILGRDVVDTGETFEIDIDDGTGACRFDFKAVFDNGKSIIRKNINVCEISSFTYTP